MINLFDYNTCFGYLKAHFDRHRGLKSKACQHMGIQTSYLSRVLSGEAQLSLEQGFLLNEFFKHDSNESDFFMLLLQKDRSGTPALKEFFITKIDKIRSERAQLKNRIDSKVHISPLDQSKYYSHWLYIVLHMLCSIPKFQNKELLIKFLGLPLNTINSAIEFLTNVGLLVQSSDGFLQVGPSQIHLPYDSPFILQHHRNWREHSIRQFDSQKKESLHYSGVFTLSEQDANLIRERLLEVIQENLKTVRPSKEEVAYVSLIDFYKLV